MLDALESRRLCAVTGLDPSYGTAGGVRVPVAGPVLYGGVYALTRRSDVVAGVFAPSGAAYVVTSEPTGGLDGDDALTRDVLTRLTPDGRPDPLFGRSGWQSLTAAFAGAYRPALAASAGGRVFFAGVGGSQLLDSTGVTLGGAGRRVRSVQSGLRPTDVRAAAFDSGGRLYVAGRFDKAATAFGVYGIARYASDGRLDTDWADNGFATGVPDGSDAASDGDSLRDARLAVAADDRVVATFEIISGFSSPDELRSETFANTNAVTLAADGTRLGSAQVAFDSVTDSNSVSARVSDVRALADGTFAVLSDGSGLDPARDDPNGKPGRLFRVLADGTLKSANVAYPPRQARVVPAGVAVGPPASAASDSPAFQPGFARDDTEADLRTPGSPSSATAG